MNKEGNYTTGYSISFKYIVIALLPILSLYVFIPLLNIGYFLLLTVIFLEMFRRKFNININFNILIVMSTLLIINLIVGVSKYSDSTNTINNTAGIAVFTLLAVIILNPQRLNKDKLYAACKIVGVIATIFSIYQFYMYYFKGTVVMGNIPFLKIENAHFQSIQYGRPTSFFYEPAHYAIYIAPIYAMSLIKKEYKYSALFLIGLIVSTSSTGVIVSMVVPLIVFLNIRKVSRFKYFFILVTTIFLLRLVGENFYGKFFDKISIEGFTSSLRVFGTLDYFRYFNYNEWFVGVGFNRLEEFAYIKGFFAYNYANTFIYLILCFGIMGALVWLGYIISLYKKVVSSFNVIYFVFIIISFSDQILFNRNLLYLLIWVYAVTKMRDDTGVRNLRI